MTPTLKVIVLLIILCFWVGFLLSLENILNLLGSDEGISSIFFQ